MTLRYLLALLLSLSAIVSFAQTSATLPLLRPTSRPSSFQGQHPATFVAIDDERFAQALALPIGTSMTMRVSLPQRGDVMLELERFSVMDDASDVWARTKNGRQKLTRPRSVLLRGVVDGMQRSSVILSCFPGYCIGYVTVWNDAEMQRYLVNPLSAGSRPSTMIIYDERHAVQPQPWTCGTVEPTNVVPNDKSGGDGVQATLRRIKLALEGDYEYYLDHGQNVNQATEYAEAVIAASSDIYQRDVSATLYIGQLEIWTTNDPYPGIAPDDLLVQFRAEWRTNNAGVDRTLAHLLSGVNRIGGIAYLDALCSKTWGYGVSGLNSNIDYPTAAYAWDTDVTSHELGHNVGSPHTHSCTWNPPIDSCVAAENGNCYAGSRPVLGTIMSYCHLTNKGTSLEFHPRVVALMDGKLRNAACVGLSTNMTVDAGRDTAICGSATVTLRATVTGGTAPYTYVWSPATGMTGSTTSTPIATPTASTTYVVEVRDQYNASVKDTIVVTVNPLVDVSLGADQVVCEGNALRLSASTNSGMPPFTYRWYAGDVMQDSVGATFTTMPSATGDYIVHATDANGCVDADTIHITVRSGPVVNILDLPVACQGEAVRLRTNVRSGLGPFAYTWFENGRKLITNTPYLDVAAGATMTYRVVVTDIGGCADTAEYVIPVHDIRYSVSPSVLPIPSLATCEDTFPGNVVIRNDGTDTMTVTVDSARSKYTIMTSSMLPATIAPGATLAMPVTVRLTTTKAIRDTIWFVDATCGRSVPLLVTGMQGGLSSSVDVTDFGTHVECTGESPRSVLIGVENTSSVDAVITSVRGSRLGSFTLSEGRVEIPARTDVRFAAFFRSTLPAGITMDTLTVSFTASSCEGTFTMPVRSTSVATPYRHDDVVEFGELTSTSNADIRRRTTIAVDIDVPSAGTITGVDIEGPFVTSAMPGQMVRKTQPLDVEITLRPSLVTTSGDIRGTLDLFVDSCAVPLRIALHGSMNAVSVSETGDAAGQPMVVDMAGRRLVVTSGMAGTVSIVDIVGRVAELTDVPAGIRREVDLSHLPSGVYVAALAVRDRYFTVRFIIDR